MKKEKKNLDIEELIVNHSMYSVLNTNEEI